MKPKGSLPCSQKSTIVSSLSQINPIKSSHPIYLRPILILSPHWLLPHPNDVFPLGFPTKTLHAFLFSPARVIRSDLIAVTPGPQDPCNISQWLRAALSKVLTRAGAFPDAVTWGRKHSRLQASSCTSDDVRSPTEGLLNVVTSLFPTLASVIARCFKHSS